MSRIAAFLPATDAVLILLLLSCPPVLAGWEVQNSGTTSDLYSVNFDHSTANRAWVCGAGGTLLYTSNGGADWVEQQSGTTEDLYGIAFHEENGAVIAVGAHGIILRTTDRGTTWAPTASSTGRRLRGASGFRFYAVGDSGTILKSTDGGLSWSSRQSGSNADLRSVHGLEPFPIAVGQGGVVLRGDPQGVSWQQMNSSTAADLNGVPLFAFSLIVGDGGTILRSTNFGADWFGVPSGTSRSLRSIADASGAIYTVGDAGTILKSTDNGGTWAIQSAPTAADINGAFFYLDPNIGYAVGDGGTILSTHDGGGGIVSSPELVPGGTRLQLGLDSSNPIDGPVLLRYSLPRSVRATLRIFDVRGQVAATLVDQVQGPGIRRATWDATAAAGGVYFVRLAAGGEVRSFRLVLIR